MDQYLVKIFSEKIDKLSISDYYGLRSPGLTCYLNSVLQVLFMTQDFREAVKRCCSEDLKPLDRHLGELFESLERNMTKTHNIIKQLSIKDVYEQRDAAEYLEKILCGTSPKASEIFKGELNHKTMCCECRKTNDSKSFFWVLPLSMGDSNSKSYNLQQGLKDFFGPQQVSGENQMFCNSCNKKQDANIKYEMIRSPEVLTLLLKRFTFDHQQKCYVKLQRRAEVVQDIELENCRYKLYAVVHHYGNLTGGHYTADIKSFETGNWYNFNDSVVKSVKPQDSVLEKNSERFRTAYLLMYRRVGGKIQKTDGSDLEARCGRSDAPNEDRRDETERGNAPVSDLLKSESCRGGDNKVLNGDLLTSDVFWSKQDKLNERAHQRAEHFRQREDTLPERNSETAGQQQDYSCNLINKRTSDGRSCTNSSERRFFGPTGQIVNNKITEKQHVVTTETGTRTHPYDRRSSRNRMQSVQTKAGSSQRKAAAASSASSPERLLLRANKPSACNGSPCVLTKSNRVTTNREQKQSVEYKVSKTVTRKDRTLSPTKKQKVPRK